MIVNRTQVADIFGVSGPTVDAWVLKGCPIKSRKGKGIPSQFDTVAVLQWLTDNNNEFDFAEERAKLTAYQAEKIKLEVKKLKGELVSVDDVKEGWIKEIMACRAKLLSMPSKMASLVFAAETVQEAQDIIKRQVCEALNELAAGN